MDKLYLRDLELYRQRMLGLVGRGMWLDEVAEHMKALGLQPLIRHGLNYKHGTGHGIVERPFWLPRANQQRCAQRRAMPTTTAVH